MESADGLTPKMLADFFVGWLNPLLPQIHLQVLQESGYAIMTVDEDRRAVVGFFTAIADH